TFSTITCCPSTCDRPAASTRATGSAVPPAAYGTTIVMGRLGHVSACAQSGARISSMAAIATASRSKARLLMIASSADDLIVSAETTHFGLVQEQYLRASVPHPSDERKRVRCLLLKLNRRAEYQRPGTFQKMSGPGRDAP